MKKIFIIIICLIFFMILPASGCKDDACEHSFSNWNTEIEPDCIHDGKQARTCTKCGYKEIKTIAALGHNFDDDGICTVCGESEKK